MRVLPVLLTAVATVSFAAHGITIDDLARHLADYPCVAGTAHYEVLMPSAAEPVIYTVDLIAIPAPETDTLAPCQYLIDWTLSGTSRTSTGFATYADGTHFRYRDTKLQEYHYTEDPHPFDGDNGGVQCTAQFTDLLPHFIGQHLRQMASDTTFRSTFVTEHLVLEGVQTIHGYDALEYTYRFDPATLLPSEIDFEYNPASISEQTVSARFEWHTIECPGIDETFLRNRYAEIFERFRTSNFSVDNLRGTQLPTYNGYTTDRRRVSYDRGTALDAPTIFVFIDPEVADNDATIKAVRTAVSSLPMIVNTVYAFTGNDPESAMHAIGTVGANESITLSCRGLARDCGVTAFPTMLLVATDGTIRDSIIGANKELSDIVTQKMILVD